MHDTQIGKIGHPCDGFQHKESSKVALRALDRIQKANDIVDGINDGLHAGKTDRKQSEYRSSYVYYFSKQQRCSENSQRVTSESSAQHSSRRCFAAHLVEIVNSFVNGAKGGSRGNVLHRRLDGLGDGHVRGFGGNSTAGRTIIIVVGRPEQPEPRTRRIDDAVMVQHADRRRLKGVRCDSEPCGDSGGGPSSLHRGASKQLIRERRWLLKDTDNNNYNDDNNINSKCRSQKLMRMAAREKEQKEMEA